MSITVHYKCAGCSAEADGTEPLVEAFIGGPGRCYNFGKYRPVNSVRTVAPDGWIAYDPYTHATYCPTCWKLIDQSSEQDRAREADYAFDAERERKMGVE